MSILAAPDTDRASAVRDEFELLARDLFGRLQGDEVLLCGLRGEDSDFVRFNDGAVRQAGSVIQRSFVVHLIRGRRHAAATVSLTGEADADRTRLGTALLALRERLPHVPEDPYLNYATEARSGERRAAAGLPAADDVVQEIQQTTSGRDLVGVYASGAVYAAHRSSLGRSNWYDTRTFNFDWSFYHAADKAVKSAYAGFQWDGDAFRRKVETATRQLDALRREPRTVTPGAYRVYLAPAAMDDVVSLIGWGGFGLKAHRTRQTPLIELASGAQRLHRDVKLVENTAAGVAPDFQEDGFVRPPAVTLVEDGQMVDTLVSPRSAMEYGVETNGASHEEAPESLEMGAGTLPERQVIEQLGTGIWIGNLHYLNYSDRPACRTTGLTRFATFWVEDGEVVAPLNVMRFDETLYRMLGENLVALTAERELRLSPGTYFARQVRSLEVPGALVEDFRLTL